MHSPRTIVEKPICPGGNWIILLTMLLFCVPFSVAAQDIEGQWESVTWLANGSVNCSDMLDDGRIFVGTAGGGIFYSDDKGDNWNKVESSVNLRYVNRIKHIGDAVFAGGQRGLYRSLDRGNTWEAVTTITTGLFTHIHKLTVDDENIYASTGSGLYYSSDLGQSWRELSSELRDPNFIYLAANEGAVYVAPRFGLFRYDHATDAVEEIELPFEQVHVMQFVGDRLFIGGGLWAESHGIYIYDHANNSWQDISGNLELPSNLRFLSAKEIDDKLYLGTEKGVYSSGDNWQWSLTHEELDDRRIQALETYDGTLFIGTVGKGMARHKPAAGTFEFINKGLNSWSVNDVWATNERLITQSYSLRLHSKHHSPFDEWDESSPGISYNTVRQVGTYKGELLMAAFKLYRSFDDGRTWHERYPDDYLMPSFLRMLPHRDKLFLFGYGDIIAIDSDHEFTKTAITYEGRTEDAVEHQGNMYVATYTHGVYSSSDEGQSWESRSAGLTQSEVYALWSRNDILLAGTKNGIFMTRNGGDGWIEISLGTTLSSAAIRDIQELDGHIYLVTDRGMFYTAFADIGLLWKQMSTEGLDPLAWLSCMAFQGRTLYVGSFGQGLYRADIARSSTTDVDDETAEQTTAAQTTQLRITPQPVQNLATIHINLDQDGPADLCVYDIRGQLVTRLALDNYVAGREYQLELRTAHLAPGQYVCTIEGGEQAAHSVFNIVR